MENLEKYPERGETDKRKIEEFKLFLLGGIESAFKHLKTELRGKVDKLEFNNAQRKIKYEWTEQANGKKKQLIDGILSKYKYELVKNIDEIVEDYINNRNLHWNEWLSPVNNDYRKRQMEADVIEPADASFLRAWLMGCFREMKKVSDYFEFNLENELTSGQK